MAKSQFLANMSHELRNPVNGIMGMLQLLGQSARDKDQIYYTGLALDSSRRLLTLLDDLLDLSRIEVGKLDLRNAPSTCRASWRPSVRYSASRWARRA